MPAEPERRTPHALLSHQKMDTRLSFTAQSRRLERCKAALRVVMSAMPETGTVCELQDAWEAVVWCGLGDVTEARHRTEIAHPLALVFAALCGQVTQDFATDDDPAAASRVCAVGGHH